MSCLYPGELYYLYYFIPFFYRLDTNLPLIHLSFWKKWSWILLTLVRIFRKIGCTFAVTFGWWNSLNYEKFASPRNKTDACFDTTSYSTYKIGISAIRSTIRVILVISNGVGNTYRNIYTSYILIGDPISPAKWFHWKRSNKSFITNLKIDSYEYGSRKLARDKWQCWLAG